VSYPKRPPYFAHKFLRSLIKQAVAQEIGPEGMCLLMCIAMTEDAKGYTGAVTFFNGQLMPVAGFRNERRLIEVRRKCVEHGLLHYEPGGKGIAGKYWCITLSASKNDGPVDENPEEFALSNSTGEAKEKRRTTVGQTQENRRESDRTSVGEPTAILPIPIPDPFPEPAASAASEAAAAETVVAAWNGSKGVSHCQSLSKSRRDKINVRLRESWWRANWLNAIERIPTARFLHENDRGWKADIDWFLRPDTAAKLLEGKYDNAGRTNGTRRNTSLRHPDDAEADWIVRDDTGAA
jgi:hypothetical protein